MCTALYSLIKKTKQTHKAHIEANTEEKITQRPNPDVCSSLEQYTYRESRVANQLLLERLWVLFGINRASKSMCH